MWLPIRKVAESCNAKVDWVDDYAIVNLRGREIKLKSGEMIASANGEKVELLKAPQIINDRTMLSSSDTMHLLELKNDLTDYENGYAMHQEFY